MVPVPRDLVAWWPGENDALDKVSAHPGTPMNGLAFADGYVGKCFDFGQGTNCFMEVPDSPFLRLTNEVTIEFWVKRRKPFGTDCIVSKGGDWTGNMLNYSVCIAPPNYRNSLAFSFAGGVRGSVSINDTRWHHCAISARNGDADPVFFLDGERQPVTYRQGEPRIRLFPSRQPLYIGGQIDSQPEFSYYSQSLVDELSVYRRTLSASEIQAIYSAGRAGKVLPLRDQARQ
jgi:hypothetical protein